MDDTKNMGNEGETKPTFNEYVLMSHESSSDLYYHRKAIREMVSDTFPERKQDFLQRVRIARRQPEPSIEQKIISTPNKYGKSTRKYIEESKTNKRIGRAVGRKLAKLIERTKQTPDQIMSSNASPEEKLKKMYDLVNRQSAEIEEYQKIMALMGKPEKVAPLQQLQTLAYQEADIKYLMKTRTGLYTVYGYIIMQNYIESEGQLRPTRIISKGINGMRDLDRFADRIDQMEKKTVRSRTDYEEMYPNEIEEIAITIGEDVYYYNPEVEGYGNFKKSNVYNAILDAIKSGGKWRI